MHLEGPWLSTTGKKKGKQKFRNAEQAKKSRLLAQEWEDLLKKHNIKPGKKITNKTMSVEKFTPSKPFYRGADTPRIPSLDPTNMAPCLKPAAKVYTGTLVKGIATMHKSNAVPIINDQEAIDIAKMRR